MKSVNKVSSKLLNAFAKIGYNTAIKASGTVSHFGCYQPKEPRALREIKKSK